MRRHIIVAFLTLAGCPAALSAAPAHGRSQAAPHAAGPPHAWLFGAWTGGLFPVIPDRIAEDCRTQTTVVFAQDAVSHATLTGTGATQRVIETVRTTPQGAEFRFTPQPGDAGFGCPDPDGLPVLRGGPNTIQFPGCTAFPYSLERCSAR